MKNKKNLYNQLEIWVGYFLDVLLCAFAGYPWLFNIAHSTSDYATNLPLCIQGIILGYLFTVLCVLLVLQRNKFKNGTLKCAEVNYLHLGALALALLAPLSDSLFSGKAYNVEMIGSGCVVLACVLALQWIFRFVHAWRLTHEQSPVKALLAWLKPQLVKGFRAIFGQAKKPAAKGKKHSA